MTKYKIEGLLGWARWTGSILVWLVIATGFISDLFLNNFILKSLSPYIHHTIGWVLLIFAILYAVAELFGWEI